MMSLTKYQNKILDELLKTLDYENCKTLAEMPIGAGKSKIIDAYIKRLESNQKKIDVMELRRKMHFGMLMANSTYGKRVPDLPVLDEVQHEVSCTITQTPPETIEIDPVDITKTLLTQNREKVGGLMIPQKLFDELKHEPNFVKKDGEIPRSFAGFSFTVCKFMPNYMMILKDNNGKILKIIKFNK